MIDENMTQFCRVCRAGFFRFKNLLVESEKLEVPRFAKPWLTVRGYPLVPLLRVNLDWQAQEITTRSVSEGMTYVALVTCMSSPSLTRRVIMPTLVSQ